MSVNSLPAFGASDVEVLERETAYQGFFSMERVNLRHRRFHGGWTPVLSRELFLRPPAVGILLYDPSRDTVVLVEQFRVGALDLEDGTSPWLLELVAGMAQAGESLRDVARREVREETGCEPGPLREITRYLSTPGGCNERIQLYCGEVDSSRAGGVHGLESENEDIRVVVMPRIEAEQAMFRGHLNNAMTLIAMQWLTLNRDSLVEGWAGDGSASE